MEDLMRRLYSWLPALVSLASAVTAAGQAAPPAPGPVGARDAAACEDLARLAVKEATVDVAQLVPAGKFSGPPAVFTGKDLSAFYSNLPAFCRVVAHARPSPDSNIGIEVWMPANGWNGRLQGLGNGGFAGQLDYPSMGGAMSRGYAATVTDTGHEGSPIDATWARGHPEKVIDFGHRGIHLMTRVAKEAVRAFYGEGPRRSYFAGCSDGGREALMEAQRYPGDYDGILAGAPANDWTHLLTTAMWDSQALLHDPASYVPPAKIPVLAQAVRAACDDADGVKDGILNDPTRCRFDPKALLCHGAESPECLTGPQVTALEKIYDGPRDSRGRPVFPPYLPGAEEGPGGWATWITGPAPAKSLIFFFGTGYFSNMVYERADWDYRTFELEPALHAAEAKTASALNATDPDLEPFAARGGKLILYHGWDDPAIPALSTVHYYEDVVARMGQGRVDSFARLFMVPGMQHCGGGPGPDSFGQGMAGPPADPRHDIRTALEAWVETGAAPSGLVAARRESEEASAPPKMTRPLCPYPQKARYKGAGGTNDASSFACAAGGDD
jgi:Tannase and feruloyl esterase